MKKSYSPLQWIVLILGIFLMFGNSVIPPVEPLTQIGVAVLCNFVAVILMLLVLDPIYPIIMSIFAFAFCGVWPMNTSLANFFGTQLFWFIAMTSIMILAVTDSGLIRRMAIWFVTRDITRKSPWILLAFLYLACLVIGLVMNTTAMTVVMFALTQEILRAVGLEKGNRTGELVMLGVLWVGGASIGSTPIGHPTPITGMTLAADLVEVGYVQYSLVGIPVCFAVLVITLLALRFIFKLDVEALRKYDPEVLKSSVGPMSKQEIISGIVFAAVVILWIAPSALKTVLPDVAAWINKFNTLGPVLVATLVFCIIRVDGEPMLKMNDGLKRLAWAGAFVAAAASGMGTAFNHPEGGVSAFIAQTFGPAFENMSPVLFVFVLCLACSIMTSFASNTVAITLTSTIGYTIIRAGLMPSINVGALCTALCICAGFAYATPPAAAYSATASTTGWIAPKSQLTNGVIMSAIGGVLCSTMAYGLGSMIF